MGPGDGGGSVRVAEATAGPAASPAGAGAGLTGLSDTWVGACCLQPVILHFWRDMVTWEMLGGDLTREAAACGGAVEGTGPVPPLPVTVRRDLGPDFIPVPRGG